MDGKSLKLEYEKDEALVKIPPPTSKKTLRSFLGMVSFYRKFVPTVSDLSAPLSDLLKKKMSVSH